MHTKDPGARSVSPVPGIVPEPVTVRSDDPPPQASTPRRPAPATTLVGKLLAALRGDKYLVNAYPPEWRPPGGGPAHPVADEPVAAAETQER